jgi:predicted dithiol-disulfide oxidoreductase (DUF899 family)
MNMPPIVSPEEWKAARERLLVKEKEHTRARDALAAERRRMPRMLVEKEYRFEGPNGPASLLDLFEGRRQLIVDRFSMSAASRRLRAKATPTPSGPASAVRSAPTRSPTPRTCTRATRRSRAPRAPPRPRSRA